MTSDARIGAGAPAVPAAPRRDIKALTGLRAVAATLVVLLHFRGLLGPYFAQVPILRSVITAGWMGVDVFFVLSGFVLTLSYWDRMGGAPRLSTVSRFLVARVARVWPAWALVTVLMAAWVWGVRRAGSNADLLAPHPPADLEHLLRNVSMTQLWGQQHFIGTSFVLPGWSISAEWLAYLCFPLLVFFFRPLAKLPAVVLVAASALVMSPMAVHAFQTGQIDEDQNWLTRITCGFIAGVLAALAVRRIQRTPQVERAAGTTATVLVAWIVGVCVWSEWRGHGDPMHDYSGAAVLLFPLLVISLSLTERGVAGFLSRPALVYGGKISYCVYLTHFVFLDVLAGILWQKPGALHEPTPGLVLAVPALVVAPFLLAAALHRWVEEPARLQVLALEKRVTARLGRGRTQLARPVAAVAALPAVPPASTAAAFPAVPTAATADPVTARLAADGVRLHPSSRPQVPARAVGASRVRDTTVSTGT